MTPIRTAASVCTVLGALLATIGLVDITSAQAQTAATTATPLAVGITAGGAAEAQVVEAVRNNDILTIKLRFKPLASKTESLYGAISKSDYENSFYVLAGNKKYLLLTDSNNQPLTNPRVIISASKDSPIAGTWYGRFPAPPKNITTVSLTIPNVETLDAIKITDR
ncbi:hypothetical protein [Paraburkholderia susongensis]|uniref:Uncharacterized protein n=1 Tax=Paraburkholderia susongensis TaxID=1515439 RepID=A0A1X7LMT7_9BURK|nr:hypothetical protein [Paraburkholderia susongensis]SMG54990.1 hypothetical protein SAMN06265784_10777 [Paraburkholderia susongensis]